ncbi:uncharacterized protein PV07_06329 [Cladophialophora immunda]|uniref:Protein kinase domain-containing protein n=1 Tax=Cladophialophora immunda TaxID=569365 RepID=A0A0D2CKM3_9EURO|nr:uncharacterized protein PV07_06329 [Cladophialophora immunda]KIW30595.1 hypothetical protein PV07_06329 [Cladophialophora immunda]
MPKEAEALRTALLMEYHRILNFADVAGLLELEYQQDLPTVLKTDKLLLVAVLSQIQNLMEDFAALNGRYDQLKDTDTPEQKQQSLATDLAKDFASITVKYERSAEKRTHLRGTNHVRAMVTNTKGIIMQPKRLWWVAFDADVFKALLGKLAGYNDFLVGILQDQHAQRVEETTRNTFIEMVQVRTSVDELKRLVTAAMVFAERETANRGITRGRAENDKILGSLASFKQSAILTSTPDAQRPPQYEELVRSAQKNRRPVSYNAALEQQKDGGRQDFISRRVNAKYASAEGSETLVWIEWKAYKTELDRSHQPQRMVPLKKNIQRVSELVTLLQMEKPKEFRVPQCLGFFDDNDDRDDDDEDDDNDHDRFGLIFEKAVQDKETDPPVSLYDAIHTLECPPLRDRIAIARGLASSILYLHAVGWLHRALRSDSVIFFREGSPFKKASFIKYHEPYLSNFEYARPERDGAATTATDSQLASNYFDLYRPPSYQGPFAQGNYRRSFDVYSFGILLLEIAAWQPIQDLVGMPGYQKANSDNLASIPGRALSSDLLSRIEQGMGKGYRTAIETCIRGEEALGLAPGDNESNALVAAKMQRAFTDKVLSAFEDVII